MDKDVGRVPSGQALAVPSKTASGLDASRFDPSRLPARYSKLTPHERRLVRQEYAVQQDGCCHYCKAPLDGQPPERVTRKPINWKRFPPNFLRWPHHLHHHHDTDLTIGVVHAYCNAVLWQYHGE